MFDWTLCERRFQNSSRQLLIDISLQLISGIIIFFTLDHYKENLGEESHMCLGPTTPYLPPVVVPVDAWTCLIKSESSVATQEGPGLFNRWSLCGTR